MKNIFLIFLFLLFSLILVKPVLAETSLPPAEFGFWLHKLDASLYSDLPKYGGKLTSITIPWATTEPQRGTYYWGELDDYFNNKIFSSAPGTKILVHFKLNAYSWATDPPPTAYPDADMPAKNLADWGDYIQTLATRYKGKIAIYSISNEAASPANWSGGTDPNYTAYAQMLQNLYTTVKSVDPQAQITNDGLSSGVTMYIYGYKGLFLNEPSPRQNAVNYFTNEIKYHNPSGAFSLPISEQSITNLHNSIVGQYAEPFWEMLLQNQSYLDFVNLHWYQTTDYLPQTLDWIKTQFPGKPLEIWETAFGYDQTPTQPYLGYNLNLQASETFKILVTGAAYGGLVQVFPWTSRQEDPPYNEFPTGAVDITTSPYTYRPAATAFKVISQYLTGANFISKLGLGQGITAFKFNNNQKDIYALWSTNNNQISLPIVSPRVISMDGSTSFPSSSVINISKDPVLVIGSSNSVSILDLRQLLTVFTNIFDYNKLVEGFGK